MMKRDEPSFWRTPSGWVALLFIAFATYFVLMEHYEHVFAFAPFAIILLCPLMHIFMHRRHGHRPNRDMDGSGHDH